MKELKSIDYQILSELLKNSRRSDRTLAKVLKTSQPTFTRRRTKLEKDFLRGYTAIPIWERLGFEIIAFTLVRSNVKYVNTEKRQLALSKLRKWFAKQPDVVFAAEGAGAGRDGIFISIHKNYSDFTEFMERHNSELSALLLESQTIIVSTNPAAIIKPFHFKYLANAK
jgi:DNA-binding Lrp family transcriptional regulator